MQRDYESGTQQGIEFFVGTEIEKTPAYGMRTLFVVGAHDPQVILDLLNTKLVYSDIRHIYFGANQSFQVDGPNDYEGWKVWEDMIRPLLKAGYLCTLDIDVRHVEGLLEGGLCEIDTFIPQISVKIPYIKQLNYNTCIKIDDKGFKASNPGVWVHQLHDLMSRQTFNDWSLYGKDEIIG